MNLINGTYEWLISIFGYLWTHVLQVLGTSEIKFVTIFCIFSAENKLQTCIFMLTFNFYLFSKKLTVKNGCKFKLKQISNKMSAKLKVNFQKIDLRFLKFELKILIML